MKNINRGIEWNIWDLHIHTPDTILSNQYKDRDWEKYIATLECLDSSIKVLGITNYYIIDDYEKVIQYKKSGRLKNIKMILPNIEMRLDNFTSKDKGINYHIIFSNEIRIEDIKNLFLKELKYEINGRKYSATKDDLIRLGRDFKNNDSLSESEALKEGVIQFKVNYRMVTKILNDNSKIFKDKYLIGAANKSKDGVSGLQEGQEASLRNAIYESCNFIFSSNPKDRSHFLSDSASKILPCIHGSDAHSYEKICKPDNQRNTWIKAEISFDGLKQIMYEPKKRVCIQENFPDDYIDYNIIDKVEFKSDNTDFGKNSLYLSSGLNVLIGGKSSGKSILLYKIAQAINDNNILDIEKESLWHNNYRNTFIENVDTEVLWKDGSISKKGDKDKRILYIPQMYINTLAERHSNKILQDKVKNILFKNENIFKQYQEYKEMLNIYVLEIDMNLKELKINDENSKEILEEIINIGDHQSILKEIGRLKQDIKIELEKNHISDEEQNIFNENEKDKYNLNLNIDENKKEILKIEQLTEEIENYIPFLKSSNDKTSFNDAINDIKSNYINDINEVKTKYTEILKVEIEKIKIENSGFEKEINIKEKEIINIKEKFKRKEAIDLLRSKLGKEEAKEKRINELIEIKNKFEDTKKGIINKIKEYVKDYHRSITIYRDTINEEKSNFNGIEIRADIKFDHEKFISQFTNKIDKRKLSNPSIQKIINVDGYIRTDIENYSKNIEEYIDILLRIDDSLFKGDINNISIIKNLCEPCMQVILDLAYGDDLITEMSPGKSGLVILKLLTHSNEDLYPILIDQPEDNLDNRTISTELVSLLRNLSEKRQVIVVTHNANLAVLTDADNIIIANQDTNYEISNSENINSRFEYINGPLESTKSRENLGSHYGKSIQEHVCQLLEGGSSAFKKREEKYSHKIMNN